MTDSPDSELRKRIDAIEEAYEFMLAYAAQGRDHEDVSEDGGIRKFLRDAVAALDGLHLVAQERLSAMSIAAAPWAGYLEILESDAARTQTLISFALSQPALSSELIDNLNATNHVRTLLTDVFLLDSAFGAHESA